MSIGGVPSTCERRVVGKFSGDNAILELAIESIELGILRVHRHGAGDSQRVVEAGASVYRVEAIEDLRHLLRSGDLVAPSVGDDLYGGYGRF